MAKKVCFFFKILIAKILLSRGFNGGSVIKTPKFHCRNMGSNPVWGSSACHKVQPIKKNPYIHMCVCVCVYIEREKVREYIFKNSIQFSLSIVSDS